jgi:type I restriction enzyme, S subunit
MKFEKVELGEICDFLYGESLPEVQRKEGQVRVYGSNGAVGWHNKPITSGPSIIIGRKGSIGKIHFSLQPCYPIDTTYYIEKTKRPTDLSWLYYLLISLDLTNLNKSAAFPGLNRDDAYEKKVIFPPLEEQKWIAQIAGKCDRLRRTLRYTQQLSDTYLQSVFQEMFGDPVTNPKNWNRAKVADIGDVETGNTPSREIVEYYGNYIEWIKSDNIIDGQMLLTKSEERLSEKGCKVGRFVGPGSILVTCIAGSLKSIGNVALTDRKVAFNQQINAVIPKKDIHPLFLYGLFLYSKSLVQKKSTSSMKRIITKSKFEEILVFKPPLPLQEKFAQIVQSFERLRAQQRESDRQAEHLFQTVLHRAFQGKL